MDGDASDYIREVLKKTNKPISITRIAREASISRTTAARYLDHLHFSGQVKLYEIGKAKKYLLSSEQRTHSICDISSDLIIFLDTSFKILYVNKAYQEYFHLSLEEIIGRRIDSLNLDIFSAVDILKILKEYNLDDFSSHIIEIIRENEIYTYELFFVKGQIGPYRAALSIIIRDITEKKRIEDENRFLASIVACSEDAIIAVNRSITVTAWNTGAERLFGYSAGEVIGRSISVIHPPWYNDVFPIHDQLLNGEVIKQYECTRQRKDGSLVDVSITASLVFDQDGGILGSSAIFRDITAYNQIKRTRSHLNLQLHALLDNIHEVLAIIDPTTHKILLVNTFGREVFENQTAICWFHTGQYHFPMVCDICSQLNLKEKQGPFSFIFNKGNVNLHSKIQMIPYGAQKSALMVSMFDPESFVAEGPL